MIGPMLSATMAVTIPRLALLMGQKRVDEYKCLFEKLLQSMIVIVLPAVVGLIMTSKNIIIIIAGEGYIRSTASLRILSLALFFGTINTIFVECVLIPAKRERATLITAIIAAVVNLSLNFVLIPLYSEKGTAMTTVIAECLSMIINFYFSKDIIGRIIFKTTFWKNNLGVVMGCIAVLCTCLVVKMIIYKNIVQFIMSVVCSCVIYVVVLYLFKNRLVVNFINNFFYRIKR